MANQLGSVTLAPRCHRKHLRRTRFARLRNGANQFTAFLNFQATRLSTTPLAIFNYLKKNTPRRIRDAVSTASLS